MPEAAKLRVEVMRDSVIDTGIPGWVILNNYPEGSDVLLADTGALRFVGARVLELEPEAPRRKPRP